jgi:hypothetical protein
MCVFFFFLFFLLFFFLSTLFSVMTLGRLTVPHGNLNWMQSDCSISGSYNVIFISSAALGYIIEVGFLLIPSVPP